MHSIGSDSVLVCPCSHTSSLVSFQIFFFFNFSVFTQYFRCFSWTKIRGAVEKWLSFMEVYSFLVFQKHLMLSHTFISPICRKQNVCLRKMKQ